MCSTVHVETMKVQTSRFITQLIQHVDDDLISDIRTDPRYWPLAVDAYGWAVKGTIRIGRDPGDIEIICNCSSLNKRGNGT